jgi:hypothetical protein
MSVPPVTPLGAALRVQAAATAEGVLGAVVDAAMATEAGAEPPTPAATPAPVVQAADAARAQAAGRQASLAPLFADLAQAAGSPTLPAQLKTAIGQVLALQTPLRGPLTAETILQAVAQSGLFLEAHLAGPAPPAAPAPTDLKAALLVLQAVLAGQSPEEAPTQTQPQTQPQPQLATAAPIPPPPHRDAALAGQPPARAALPPGAPAASIVQRLTGEVAQAVARQSLHQLASLPDGAANSAWVFELPLGTPQGTAIAQFEVRRDRDEPGAGGSDAEPAGRWKVRFSIDIEPLGPVHVHLAAAGEGAQVTIWAEREGSLEPLRAQGEALARALPAQVVFRPGAPSRPVPASGQFVDRSL